MTNSTLPERPQNPTPQPVPQSAPQPTPQAQETVKVVTRFAVLQRIEHIILLLSFTTLAVTGLPQKFASTPLSQFVIELFGGIESIRVVHRTAAIILMILSIYHVVVVLYRIFVQRVPLTMFPVVEDFKHLWHDLLFYFGRRKHKAYYGRYNYAEKAEYLAVVWGVFIMIITGFMMWNPIATTNYLPGQFIPAAKVAHGGEAVLAVLAIILWHFYHVHLRHFNKSMFTGKMTRHEMEEEHPAELALIEEGKDHKPPPPTVLRRRQKIFYPIASVIVIVSGILLLGFVTFEKTAIETVPPAITGEAFVPYTPTPTIPPTRTPVPTATPTPGAGQPVAGPAWDTTISAIFNAKCAGCHVSASMGGLSLKTYTDALKGGAKGPAIVPNNPEASVLVQVQQAGGHSGQLSADELAQVIAWIEAGAPETGGAATPPPTTSSVEGWTGGIDQLVNAKCAACHVNAAMGGLSLKTYADALKGGQDGPAIVPNDPDKSVLVQVQQKGSHSGQFTPEELDRVIAWIKAGAPETSSGAGAAPVATPIAASAVNSWADAEAIFVAKCAMCHINSQAGNLSLKTYTDTLKGGNSGPAIVPGEPDQSALVTIQQGTAHPSLGRLTPEELAPLIAWIEKGAPEIASEEPPASEAPPPSNESTSSSTTPSGGSDAWTGGIDLMINAKCAGCHVSASMGNLSLRTYADALKGGKSGPAIVPNEPAASTLVTVQQKGGHPGQLMPEEIDRIVKWIEAGAPETSSTSGPAPAATPAATAGIKTWAEAAAIFTTKCAMCHINSAAGNLSLKTYAEALKGGKSGPAIVAGDPDNSPLVIVPQSAPHPAMGKLSPEELTALVAWIEAGAPEK
jgi:cytochrome b subunit of formate dehydrogenase/mono/diheme cytochrome c family protein